MESCRIMVHISTFTIRPRSLLARFVVKTAFVLSKHVSPSLGIESKPNMAIEKPEHLPRLSLAFWSIEGCLGQLFRKQDSFKQQKKVKLKNLERIGSCWTPTGLENREHRELLENVDIWKRQLPTPGKNASYLTKRELLENAQLLIRKIGTSRSYLKP